MILICAVDNQYRAEQVKEKPARARSGHIWSSVKKMKQFSLFPHWIYPWDISIWPGGRLLQFVAADPARIERTALRRRNGCKRGL
jgi:hypothetical protein